MGETSEPVCGKYKKIKRVCWMLTFLVTALSVTVFAWYSVNSRVRQSGGVSARVDTYSNLIIAPNREALINRVNLGSANNPFEVTEALGATMYPCTRRNGTYQYVTNTGQVDVFTGWAVESATLTYATVAESARDKYYKDVTVYISSANKDFPAETELYASIDTAYAGSDSDQSSSHQAFTVDFFMDGNYISTLNTHQEKVAKQSTGANAKTKLYTGPITRPNISEEKTLTVTMRFYFDGAASASEGSAAFINSDTVNTNDLVATVIFSVE